MSGVNPRRPIAWRERAPSYPLSPDTIAAAVALAARSDVAILFAGLTNEWESENYDRTDMELRGAQVELIENVAAANLNTIVVLNTGSPVTMNWLEQVPAVMQAWFGAFSWEWNC